MFEHTSMCVSLYILFVYFKQNIYRGSFNWATQIANYFVSLTKQRAYVGENYNDILLAESNSLISSFAIRCIKKSANFSRGYTCL